MSTIITRIITTEVRFFIRCELGKARSAEASSPWEAQGPCRWPKATCKDPQNAVQPLLCGRAVRPRPCRRRRHKECAGSNRVCKGGWDVPLRIARSRRTYASLKLEEAHIIDVGAGASVLVDDLLDAGYCHVTVLDISTSALAASPVRLDKRAEQVNWLIGDIRYIDLPPATYDIWHDRAVSHFLKHEEDRKRYVDQVCRSVRPGGYVVVATFGPNGPSQCSNLDVRRYALETLHPGCMKFCDS